VHHLTQARRRLGAVGALQVALVPMAVAIRLSIQPGAVTRLEWLLWSFMVGVGLGTIALASAIGKGSRLAWAAATLLTAPQLIMLCLSVVQHATVWNVVPALISLFLFGPLLAPDVVAYMVLKREWSEPAKSFEDAFGPRYDDRFAYLDATPAWGAFPPDDSPYIHAQVD
jgi:hypothetical protein